MGLARANQGRPYFPGRTGQLLLVPRRGDFITRPDPYYIQMHGSPWPYDVDIPLMFTGPAVKAGRYSMAAAQKTSHQRSPPRWVSRCRRPLAREAGMEKPPTSGAQGKDGRRSR